MFVFNMPNLLTLVLVSENLKQTIYRLRDNIIFTAKTNPEKMSHKLL